MAHLSDGYLFCDNYASSSTICCEISLHFFQRKCRASTFSGQPQHRQPTHTVPQTQCNYFILYSDSGTSSIRGGNWSGSLVLLTNWNSYERSSAWFCLVPKITTFHFSVLRTSIQCCIESVAGFISVQTGVLHQETLTEAKPSHKMQNVLMLDDFFWSASTANATFWTRKLVCRSTHHLNVELVWWLLLPTVS